MSTARVPPPLRLRGERGFSLLELLVAMAAGIVVTGALLAILEVSLRQETRISDRVQADRIGRTALTNMLDELHSSCTGFGSTAIQAPSTTPTSPLASTGSLNLWFLTAYGSSESGAAAVKGVTEHDINWTFTGTSKTGAQLGTLTDYAWNSTGGEPPSSAWTFNSTLSTITAEKVRVLAKNVVPKESSTLFHYYQYDTVSTDATYGQLVPLTASELPPTSTTAKKIAKATIAYNQAPENGDTREGYETSFSGAVVLRLTPTESSSEGSTCA
jgi:Tfp pilus assembly protein PilW